MNRGSLPVRWAGLGRVLVLWGAFVFSGLTGLTGCGGSVQGAEAGEGVLVIAVDGLRSDHLSCYGYDRPTTPTMDRLAADGVLFRQAFTTAPQRLPAHVSLLTGCDPYPARRYLIDEVAASVERRWEIPSLYPRLAVEYLAEGRATAAFVDHPELASVYGFGAGFQKYVESEAGADVLGPRFLQWLRSLDRSEPWFAYLHLSDLERAWIQPDHEWESYFTPRPELDHVPPVGSTDSTFFAIPRSRWRGGSRSLGKYEAIYDGHLRKLDGELERLLGSMKVSGRLENTTVVLVGTYGVQFGEATLYLAGGGYSMADLSVPLIVKPGKSNSTSEFQRGVKIDGLASIQDIAPTLLELSGLPLPAGTHGVSQLGFITGAANREQPPVSTYREFVFSSCGRQEGCTVIGEQWCLEFLLPAEVEDATLRRSWFGEWLEHEDDRGRRFYDRLEDPFPPLDLVFQEGPGASEAFEAHRNAAAHWLQRQDLLRRVLQPLLPGMPPPPAGAMKRLREEGLLGDGR